MASDHQIQVQPRPGVNTAAPAAADFVQLLATALTGGDAVYDFFSGNFSALQQMYQTIATGGDEVWLDGTDSDTGLPVQYVAQGSTFLTVTNTFTDTDTLKNGTGSTSTFKPVGTAVVTFTTDQGTSQIILNDIHYAGLGLGALLTTPVLTSLAKPIVQAVASWVKNTAIRIFNKVTGGGSVDDPAEADSAVETEAGEAAAESGETAAEVAPGLFADVAITVAQGVLFAVGIGILAVVFVLELLAKQITAQVRFYNLTAAAIPFGIGFVDSHTALSSGPAAVGSTAVVPKVSKAIAPPGVQATDTGIYYAEAALLNSNELYGVGYVLDAEPAGSFPGFKVAVEIPSTEDNSMYLAFTTDSSNDVWTQFSNNPDAPTVLTAQTASGQYSLQVATNATNGRHPSPLSGEVGYYYEHLVVLTDGSVTA